jgi:outer membrane protein assembly factor BamB
VPAGNKLQKIMEDATQTPQEIWNYDAAAADIVGGPVLSGWNVIYAGLSNGRYIAVDDADGTILNGHWPYYCGAADSVNAGPWIDNDAGCVMFGTNGGKLDAFPLEQP